MYYIYPFKGDDFRTFVNMVSRSALFWFRKFGGTSSVLYIYPFQGDDFRTFVNMVTRSALFCSLLKFCLQRNPLSVNKKHAQFYGFLETPVKGYFKFSWIKLGIADKKLFTACQKSACC